jgi:hypothetical protein
MFSDLIGRKLHLETGSIPGPTVLLFEYSNEAQDERVRVAR